MKVRRITPGLWARLPFETTDCLAAWWGRVGPFPLRECVTWTMDGETLEVVRASLDANGYRQVDPDSPEPQMLTETVRVTPSEPVPDCWPDEAAV